MKKPVERNCHQTKLTSLHLLLLMTMHLTSQVVLFSTGCTHWEKVSK